MELFFSPLGCSMASRIALYEAGASATFTEVDPVTKLTAGGTVYRDIYPLGLVPALRTEQGDLLTENAAILQYLAERFPEAGLAPRDALGTARLQQWLCFVGTELHKTVFSPLLDRAAPEGARAYALEKATARLDLLERHLAGREFLLDAFSVADAYLFTVLGWSVVTPIELGKWPALAAYHERLSRRPSVARARAEEGKLYAEERARHRAA
jgi:glutathione S-transferase